MPTLFYSTNSDLLTTVYDPRVKLSYQQNIGDATGYGLEVETTAFITDHITLFVNPTYCILTYDDDLTYREPPWILTASRSSTLPNGW